MAKTFLIDVLYDTWRVTALSVFLLERCPRNALRGRCFLFLPLILAPF